MKTSKRLLISAVCFAGILTLLLCCCTGNKKFDVVATPHFDSILNAASRMSESGEQQRAFEYVRQAHAAGGLSLPDEFNYLNFCYIDFYDNKKDYMACSALADSMIQFCESNKDSKIIREKRVFAYSDKADALMALGAYLESYDYYYKAKQAAMENEDSCGLSRFTYSMGMVLYKQQKFLESAENFKQAFREESNCDENFKLFYKQQEILDNLGLCYWHAGCLDSAIVYYQKAIGFIEENEKKFPTKSPMTFAVAKAVAMGNLAQVLVQKGDKSAAIALMKESIAINLQKGYCNGDAELNQIKLARLYFENGNIQDAEHVLNCIHAELDTVPDRNVEQSWNQLMWKLKDYQHDPAGAYPFLKNYVRLSDSTNVQKEL